MIQAIKNEIEHSISQGLKCAVITCDENIDEYKNAFKLSLGSNKKPDELASHLFECLRECDNRGIEIIFSESFDETEMGLALMNRLKKAAGFKIIDV